jgi:hypothetical protein
MCWALFAAQEVLLAVETWKFMAMCVITVNLKQIFRHVDATLPKYLIRRAASLLATFQLPHTRSSRPRLAGSCEPEAEPEATALHQDLENHTFFLAWSPAMTGRP